MIQGRELLASDASHSLCCVVFVSFAGQSRFLLKSDSGVSEPELLHLCSFYFEHIKIKLKNKT